MKYVTCRSCNEGQLEAIETPSQLTWLGKWSAGTVWQGYCIGGTAASFRTRGDRNMPRKTKHDNPYSGFGDDKERRIALRNRDIRLTFIAICSGSVAVGVLKLQALLHWLSSLLT